MVREDLISSAVSFLQDPSVAASALDKRIAFLHSKNLTQEEIDVSLARAGDGSAQQNVTPPAPSQGEQGYGYSGQQVMRQPVGYGYGPFQGGPWGPPPEPPARDWRDWFIMATVTSGVGYGLYVVAKRYIMPLIAPPTPPQLEQDKSTIDASFARAFALIDQLATDTASLKASEAERTEKLDTTLRDVDAVITDLKAARTRQENEARSVADQVQGLKDLVPKALEGWKESGDRRLEELGVELRSLKKLVSNRVGGGGPPPSVGRGFPSASIERTSGSSTPTGASSSTPNGIATECEDKPTGPSSIPSAPAPGVTVPRRETPSVLQSSGRAAIPAWQMAASSGGGSSKKGEDSVGAGA